MEKTGAVRRIAWIGAGLVALLGLTGCGELTIRTWVKVIEADSTGFVKIGAGVPLPITRIQGGFLANIVMDTTTIPAPLEGTLVVEEIRLAAIQDGPLQYVCAWANPNLPSEGTVFLDILGGEGSTQVDTNLRTVSGFGGGIVTDVATSTELNLEGDLLTAFLGAAESGAADGLFATRAPFVGTSELAGLPVLFSLDLGVTNDTTPPVFDADNLYNCAYYWEGQDTGVLNTAVYHGMNSKSSYLRAWPGDDPKPPRVISLADLGIAPGETLKLDTIGAYADTTKLEDGTKTTMTAVFSSTNQLLGTGQRNRIPGAINAGADVDTGGFLKCFLIFCSFQSSDISQDFRVDPGLSVVVPAGANYLFVAPLPPSRKWSDNSGFGFGVDADPGPYPYDF
jgi:hypothetical protein